LPCDVLNYLVSTEFKTATGCLLCVLPVSRTLVRLKHVCIFHKKTARWQMALQTSISEYCKN